jgi:DNA-binding GntR family transcriptional regulator
LEGVNTLGPGTIARSGTLAEQAADAIRERIVTGKLQLGEALSETAVAAELGVSKTPVREAFLLLKTEGLVDILPQRGTFVFRMDVTDAHKLTQFREVLETAALRFSLASDAAGLGRRLATIADDMEAALAENGQATYQELDALFHQRIVGHADNGYLSRAYAAVAFRMQALRYRLAMDSEVNAHSLEQHLALARLVSRGLVEEAVDLLREHVRRTLEDYANTMRSGACSELALPPPNPARRGGGDRGPQEDA